MDYFVELARHPDVLQAIGLDPSKTGRDLMRLSFLKDEHPNTWTAELVHAFYAEPEFACRVWVNLRYCDDFRTILAEHTLDRQLPRRGARTVTAEVRQVVPDQLVADFKKDRACRRLRKAARLGSGRH